MAYIQPNNPFPVTSCGRRRTFTQGGSPGKDRTEESPFMRTKPHTSWTQSDRDKYRRENPSSNLKDPQPGGGSRKNSYCARSAGIKKCKNPDKNGDCPNDIARRKWKC
jgi:hypothetical protein